MFLNLDPEKNLGDPDEFGGGQRSETLIRGGRIRGGQPIPEDTMLHTLLTSYVPFAAFLSLAKTSFVT